MFCNNIYTQHGKFVLDDNSWSILDNKSTNGILVNGEKIGEEKHELKDGDIIIIGRDVPDTECKYLFNRATVLSIGQLRLKDDITRTNFDDELLKNLIPQEIKQRITEQMNTKK